jgi:hypothetical protein
VFRKTSAGSPPEVQTNIHPLRRVGALTKIHG